MSWSMIKTKLAFSPFSSPSLFAFSSSSENQISNCLVCLDGSYGPVCCNVSFLSGHHCKFSMSICSTPTCICGVLHFKFNVIDEISMRTEGEIKGYVY
jgi:hypothetical protein